MIQFLPVILLRMGTLPVELLEQMNWKKDWLRKLSDHDVEIQNAFASLSRELTALYNQAVDESLCRNVTHIQNKVAKQQWPSAGKVKRLLTFSGTSKIKKTYHQLQTLREQKEELELSFHHAYESQLEIQLQTIQQCSFEPSLLNGISMSSHSLYQRIVSLQNKTVDGFRKKELQSSRTLWQYLSRICYKTSPFSTFTALAIYQSSMKVEEPLQLTRQVKLNHLIYGYLQELLSQHPVFYRQLSVHLNETLQVLEAYTFILNTRNIESLQRIEKDAVLDFVVEQLTKQNSALSFFELTQLLQNEIEAEQTELESYLFQLIQLGFLEWEWPVSGMHPQWAKAFLEDLQNGEKDELLEELIEVLEQMYQGQLKLETAKVDERISIQQNTHTKLKAFWERHKTLFPNQDHSFEAEDAFRRLTSSEFIFQQEQIYFEDARITAPIALDESFIQAQCSLLNELLNAVYPLQEDQFGYDLLQFFQMNFTIGEAPELLVFYHAFKAYEGSIEYTAYREKQAQIRAAWKAGLIPLLDLTADEIVLNLHEIQRIFTKLHGDDLTCQPVPNSVGAMLQIGQSNGEQKIYVDTCFPGYGKMMGRFLPLFPKEVTEQIQAWNEAMQEEELWVELSDASFFNANVHPNFLPFEVRMPGSQNNLRAEQQISVADLVVTFNDIEGALDLLHVPTKRKVKMFDLGFEALANRSPLYRFLAHFCKRPATYHPLRELINSCYQEQKQREIIFHPRICLQQNLILQRRRWYFPLEELKRKEKGVTDSTYFLQINEWRRLQHLPQVVFYNINPKEIDISGVPKEQRKRLKKEDYKPCRLDFNHPLDVQLFARALARVPLYLKIEELWPKVEDGWAIEGKHYVAELVVQWENKLEDMIK